MKGVTTEIINNITKSINKSYTNLTVDKIIKAVHNGFIKPFKHPILEQLDNRKASTLVTQTKTLGEKTFVFPGVDPFKVINQLSNEAEVDPSLDISSGNNFKYFQIYFFLSYDKWVSQMIMIVRIIAQIKKVGK